MTSTTHSVTLNGYQLREALQFAAPDGTDDQLETDVVVTYGTGHSGEGVYCHFAEYPDEGAVVLDAEPRPKEPGKAAGDPSDFRGCLFEELSQLHGRIAKLQAFIVSDSYSALPNVVRADLNEQLRHMVRYFAVLSRRASRDAAWLRAFRGLRHG